MKINQLKKVLCGIGLAGACGLTSFAQTNVPSTFKHITIDGSFDDWTGVPLAYTAVEGPATAIQYQNVYIANDESNLYIRVTLYSPRAAFQNSYDNIFIDTDNNPSTGYGVGGIGSEMLIQWGGGYQEKNGGFNEGGVNNLGWNLAGSADSLDYEVSISLGATFASDNTQVFAGNTIAMLFEGDNSGYNNVEFAPPFGGLVYTFATNPPAASGNLPLITLANSSWQANASGTDLGTNWLDQTYDDTVAGWVSGEGLFGYTPSPASYPAINTPLASGPNTYYFRTRFQWTNDTANVAFVVTNYLSDGAVYYLNGNEVRRVRMPSGTVTYATAASATNSPTGHPDVFGIDASSLLPVGLGDNILEVETHQAPGSSADMVFGLSLTAASNYGVLNVSTNLPADQTVLAGQPVTLTSDVIGSGPLTYQWYFDGSAIAGANAAAYTIPLVLTNNAGTYSLQVSNSFSGITSRTALLTVSNTPIIITAQPANQVALEGGGATFSVGVSGTPLIQYQWWFGGNPLSGQTNATLTIPVCVLTNSGVYQVVISNPADSTNSIPVDLTVLPNTIPPNLTAISASASQIVVTFSEPVDAATAGDASKYSVSGGITVSSAVPNPGNASQVTLTTGAAMNWGAIYTLSVNGVKDLYGNASYISGQFTRDITIDGSFDDWTGLPPIYTSAAPSGNTDAADFEAIYVYNDANYYYFRVTLWTDLDPINGHFPTYVNMFFDTDNNASTGYAAFGSDMLVQSGYSYQEKDGNFNDGFGINNLNWLCLPASTGTNFEFQLSRAATFGEDGTPVFSTNVVNFLFQGLYPSYAVANSAPPSGILSYTNITSATAAPLSLSKLSLWPLPGKQAAIVWYPPGTLQVSSSVKGPWTNMPPAASPYVVPVSGTSQFFRLSQ